MNNPFGMFKQLQWRLIPRNNHIQISNTYPSLQVKLYSHFLVNLVIIGVKDKKGHAVL